MPMSAAHSFAADSTRILKTTCKSKVERLMTLSTSAVAHCRCNDSFSSRVRCATFVSWLVEDLRGRPAFDAMRLLRAAAFRPCALGDLPPALDRRRMCRPSAQDKASWRGQTSTMVDGSSHV